MSTELGIIKGEIEGENKIRESISYIKEELGLIRYSSRNGIGLQLTLKNSPGYIQITDRREIEKLRDILNDFLESNLKNS